MGINSLHDTHVVYAKCQFSNTFWVSEVLSFDILFLPFLPCSLFDWLRSTPTSIIQGTNKNSGTCTYNTGNKIRIQARFYVCMRMNLWICLVPLPVSWGELSWSFFACFMAVWVPKEVCYSWNTSPTGCKFYLGWIGLLVTPFHSTLSTNLEDLTLLNLPGLQCANWLSILLSESHQNRLHCRIFWILQLQLPIYSLLQYWVSFLTFLWSRCRA